MLFPIGEWLGRLNQCLASQMVRTVLHREANSWPRRKTLPVRFSVPIVKVLGTLRQDHASDRDNQASSNNAHSALILVFCLLLSNKA